jgi:hypothetical protein
MLPRAVLVHGKHQNVKTLPMLTDGDVALRGFNSSTDHQSVHYQQELRGAR